MKIILTIILCVMLLGIPSFAQQAKEAAEGKTEIAVGKIMSIYLPSAENGKIDVVDQAGEIVTFTVDSTTKVLEESVANLDLKKLKKDDSVKVNYSETEKGTKKANSIKVTK